MSKSKRPWGVVAAPIIFFGGLVVFLGVQKAGSVKDLVERWGYELEHSSKPVVMEMPVYVPLFVGGDWMGRLQTVVVDRDRPRAIDGVHLVAQVHDDDLASLQDCALRLRVRGGDISDFKRALRCTSDTKGLVAFGDLDVPDARLRVPVMVSVDDLPCHERDIHVGPCDRARDEFVVSSELETELQGLAEELRRTAREFRTTVRSEVREKVRGIR
jgi:hypothetical protein